MPPLAWTGPGRAVALDNGFVGKAGCVMHRTAWARPRSSGAAVPATDRLRGARPPACSAGLKRLGFRCEYDERYWALAAEEYSEEKEHQLRFLLLTGEHPAASHNDRGAPPLC